MWQPFCIFVDISFVWIGFSLPTCNSPASFSVPHHVVQTKLRYSLSLLLCHAEMDALPQWWSPLGRAPLLAFASPKDLAKQVRLFLWVLVFLFYNSGGKHIYLIAFPWGFHKITYEKVPCIVFNLIKIWRNWCLSLYRIHLQCGRPGFDSWVGKIPWRRERLPTPVFLPGEFHGQRRLAGCSPWGCIRLGHNLTTNTFTLWGYWHMEENLRIIPSPPVAEQELESRFLDTYAWPLVTF